MLIHLLMTCIVRICVHFIYDVVEAHCYIVDIGQTYREQIRTYVAESITTDAGRFSHVGLCQKYAVDKGLRGRNILHQLLLILLRICS